jgi:selenocysteine-specific elongation factor
LRGEFVRYGGLIVDRAVLDDLVVRLHQLVSEFHEHNPLAAGIPMEELRTQSGLSAEVFAAALGRRSATNVALRETREGHTTISGAPARRHNLEISGDLVHLPGRGVVMKDDEAESRKTIESAFASAGLKVPALKDVLDGLKIDKARAQKLMTLLLREKVLVKVSADLVFHQTALAQLRRRLDEQKSRSPRIDVSGFKELTGVSRKYAIPLLEYLDRERVTRREGDQRIIL